jgi:hypothetical protein
MPSVISLILCEKLSVDPRAGKTSLEGLFSARRYRKFPTAEQPFTAYVALYDGEGEGTMELMISRFENEKDIYSYKRWIALPGRGVVVNLEVPIRKCHFPAPGRYLLSLRFNGKEITRRLLDVFRTRRKT